MILAPQGPVAQQTLNHHWATANRFCQDEIDFESFLAWKLARGLGMGVCGRGLVECSLCWDSS